jgi:hypothetical protein
MQRSSTGIIREIGTALAVLSLYVLTLLLPLHQAAGLQNDLARLGFETVGSWSICADAGAADKGEPQAPAALKCPAAGIGKHEFAAILPVVLGIAPPESGRPFLASDPVRITPAARHAHVGQSRAPPAQA